MSQTSPYLFFRRYAYLWYICSHKHVQMDPYFAVVAQTSSYFLARRYAYLWYICSHKHVQMNPYFFVVAQTSSYFLSHRYAATHICGIFAHINFPRQKHVLLFGRSDGSCAFGGFVAQTSSYFFVCLRRPADRAAAAGGQWSPWVVIPCWSIFVAT